MSYSTEYGQLWLAWRRAERSARRYPTRFNEQAEQVAYDALVDYVEANDLNYTEFDPRGPRTPDEGSNQ